MLGRLCILYALFTVVTGLTFFNTPSTATVGQSFSVEWTADIGDPDNIPLYLKDDTTNTIQQFTTIQTNGPGSSGTVDVTVSGSPGRYRIVSFSPSVQPSAQGPTSGTSQDIDVKAGDSSPPQGSQQPSPSSSSTSSTQDPAPSSTSSSSSQDSSPSSSSSNSSPSSTSQSNPSSSSPPTNPDTNTTTSTSSSSLNATTPTTLTGGQNSTNTNGTTSTTGSGVPSSTSPSSQSKQQTVGGQGQPGNSSGGTNGDSQTGSQSPNPTDTSSSISPSNSGSGAVSDNSGSNKGVIIGAVVGALLGLLLLIGLIILVHRVRLRRQRETITFYRERMVRNDIPPRPSTESINDETQEKLSADLL